MDLYISLYPKMVVLKKQSSGIESEQQYFSHVLGVTNNLTWFLAKRFSSETDLKTLYLSQCFPHNYLKPVVGPTSKLHLTILIIEREPGDVDLAGGHEDPGGDVGALSLMGDHHVSWVGSVKGFTCTANDNDVNPSVRSGTSPHHPADFSILIKKRDHFNLRNG